MAKYAIVSLNEIRGFVKGHFANLNHVYLESFHGHDEGAQATWTDSLRGALLWDTEAEAWEFVDEIWRPSFVDLNFSVMSIRDRYLEDMEVYEPIPGEAARIRREQILKTINQRSIL